MHVNFLKELSCESPALSLDWAIDAETGEVSLGVATRGGKFFIVNPTEGEIKEHVELDPPTPIWRVVGNHHASPGACAFALATLDGGVIGIKGEEGVMWQHPFGSSCGTISFADHAVDGTQLVVAGGLDRSLRGIDPVTGKFVWGAMFPAGVGFVDIYPLEDNIVAVAGDTAGAVRSYDAFSGTMLWYADFGASARFCVPLEDETATGESLWMAGTDEKMVHIFPVAGEKAGAPVTSAPCIEYPWQARHVAPGATVVTMYNFANILGEEPSAAGQIAAFSNDGRELWSTTIAGSAEDFVISEKGDGNAPALFVGTTIGTVLQLDSTSGEVQAVLPLANEPLNGLKQLPSTPGADSMLAVACDDGRIFLVDANR